MPPEKASTNLLHHRETDPPGSDYRRARYAEEREVIVRRDNSLQKWALATILSLGVALLAYLAARDRVSVDAQFGRINTEQATLTAMVSRHEAEIMVIKAKQDRVLADLAENSRKLDLLLLEARKR